MPHRPLGSGAARVPLTICLASLVGTLVLATGNDSRPAAGQPRQRSGRAMFVSVLDRNGAPVTDLAADDFVVREDGVRREVLRAERATDPILLALLVDNSTAASPYVADMRRALARFVRTMGGTNPISLVTFGDRPTLQVDYTRDVAALEGRIERLFAAPDSGAWLIESVFEACGCLAKRDADRAEIVAITVDGPEFSERSHDQVLARLQESGARFDAIVISTDTALDLRKESARNRAALVGDDTRATGGERFTLLSSMALDDQLGRMAAELSNQYRVTYWRPDALIPPHRIEVAVRRPDLVTRGTPVRAGRG